MLDLKKLYRKVGGVESCRNAGNIIKLLSIKKLCSKNCNMVSDWSELDKKRLYLLRDEVNWWEK